MKVRRLAWLAALAACALAARADDIVSKAVGGRPATTLLSTMLNPTPESQRLADVSYVAGYEVLGKPVAIPADDAAKLAELMKNSAAFERPDADEDTDPGTAYRPGVAFQFGTGRDAVELLVCFSCDKVAIVPAGGTWIAGIRNITQPARDVFLGISKKLLPRDEGIQALPRVRSKNPVPPPSVPIPADAPRPGDAPSPEK